VNLGVDKYPSAITCSPDGKLLAVVGEKNGSPVAHLWEMTSAKHFTSFEAGPGSDGWIHMIEGLAFSADSRQFAVGGNGSVCLYEVTTKRKLREWRVSGDTVPRTVFTAGGKVLVAQDDEAIRFWDIATGIEMRRPAGHTRHGGRINFSADGRVLASAGSDGSVRVWDPVTGRQVHNLGAHDSGVSELAGSADGRVLVSYDNLGDKMVRVWDAARGTSRCAFAQEPIPVMLGNYGVAVSITEDGKIVAVASRWGGPVQLHDAMTGKERRRFDWGYIEDLTLSPNGSTLAVVGRKRRETRRGGKTLDLFEVVTGKLLQTITLPANGPENGFNRLVFSPDNKLLSVYHPFGGIQVWELLTQQIAISVTRNEEGSGWFAEMGIARDGRVLFVKCRSQLGRETFYLGEQFSGECPLPVLINEFQWGGFAFSPDGTRLAQACSSGPILLWDVDFLTGKVKTPAPRLNSGAMDSLWSDLASQDAARAYKAVLTLGRSPQTTVAYLTQRLKPAREENYAHLLAKLDDKSFAVRQAASKDLKALGSRVESALREVLQQKPSPEMRQRVESLLQDLRKRPVPLEELRPLRSVQILEHIASPDAQRLLGVLGRGASEARLTREAKASLARLGKLVDSSRQ
jgi:WD40 repeat protein